MTRWRHETIMRAAGLETMRRARRWNGIEIPVTKQELKEIGGGFQIEGAESINKTSCDCDEQEHLVDVFQRAGEAPNIDLARGTLFGTIPDGSPDQPSREDLEARNGEPAWEISHRGRF
ncbi:MAG: hypothetical protein WC528_01460 [Patescibacteria group bacterium]